MISIPIPPRPDNTVQTNVFGGISGPMNPFGFPTVIPRPNPGK